MGAEDASAERVEAPLGRRAASPTRAQALGSWIAQLSPEQVGPERLNRMRTHLLDTVGVAIAGAFSEPSRIAAQVFAAQGQVPVLAPLPPRSAVDAARVNAVSAHAYEFDDTEGCDHTGAVVVPVVLSLAAGAEDSADSADEQLTAMVAGYETGRRVQNALGGYAAHNDAGWHSTATCGVFAAAAAAARLLRLSPTQTASALGIAASASGGTWAFAADGAMTKRLHPAQAAGSGIEAALLARAGAVGPMHVFDAVWGGHLGLFGGVHADPDALTRELGERWHADHSAIKLYASCRSAHAALDGVADMLRHTGMTADDVREVTVTVSPFLRRMICPDDVSTLDAARMSLPLSLALMLCGEALDPRSFERRDEPEVLRVLARIRIVEEEHAPHARVRLAGRDGVWVVDRQAARGSERMPIPRSEVEAKFRRNVAGLVDTATADALVGFADADTFSRLPDITWPAAPHPGSACATTA